MQKNDVYQQVTDKIIAELEKGAAPWVRPWGSSQLTSPRNAASNRPYSGVNVILLWMEAFAKGYSLQRWLTFKQAKAAGGMVRKGEKGTHIVFMSVFEKNTLNDRGEIVTASIPVMRGYTVFNVAQCDKLPDRYTAAPMPVGANDSGDDSLDEFIRSTGAQIAYGGDRACYIPALDSIRCPHLRDFKNAANFYSTQFHELAHWTGAKHRLNRDLSGRFGDEAYAGEELVAELAAAMLCAEKGVQHTELRHAGYIGHWLKVMQGDRKAIFTAASMASKAAEFLMKTEETDSDADQENESVAA